MSTLVPFHYADQPVRTVLRDGEPWFVAADVCKVLGYTNSRKAVGDHVAPAHKGVSRIVTPSGEQDMAVLDESGLYRLIMRSNVEGADQFQEWVTAEVLPSIRKTGSYNIDRPSNVTKLPSRRDLAQMVIDAEDRAAAAEQQVETLEPAARFADDLASREGNWSVEAAAKLLANDPAIRTGPRLLFQTLHDWGWICRREGRWAAKQGQINTGRLVHKVYDPRYDADSGRMIDRSPQVRLTWKGLRELHQRLGGSRPLMLRGDEQSGEGDAG